MPLSAIKNFFKLEASAGIILGIAALMALLLENSPIDAIYDSLLKLRLAISVGDFGINKPLLLWINDGLMAVFFLLVGLEIKREVLDGQLSNKEQISLPLLAATGGIIVPALIYYLINVEHPEYLQGWAIPAATDIAFALGILTLLGSRVHDNLKITLLAIAIIDDLVAIVIIAIFYTKNLSLVSIGLAGVGVIILACLNLFKVTRLSPYIITGIFMWACVLKSGVHATLAGVVLALFIPFKSDNPNYSPLSYLEHELHPWVAYMVLPIFAFANAGVSLKGLSADMMMMPITLGITAGLFIGKPLGVLSFALIGVACKLCKLPNHVNYAGFIGMACLTGVGFTMSLFIGTLAFDDYHLQTAVRLGVISGSLLSGIVGFMIFQLCTKKRTVHIASKPERSV